MPGHVGVPGVRVHQVDAAPAPATIDRSTPSVCSAGFAVGQRAAAGGARTRPAAPGARLAEAVHVDVDQLAQRRDQVLDVHAGAAVDVRGVLAGEQADAHPCTVGHRGRASGDAVAPGSSRSAPVPLWPGRPCARTRVGRVTTLTGRDRRPDAARLTRAAAAGQRAGHRARRRRGQAAVAAHRRPGQAGGAVRRQLPADRLRAVQPGQRRAAPDLRAHPVQVALAGPAHLHHLAAVQRARAVHHHGAGPAAARPALVHRQRRRDLPEPQPGLRRAPGLHRGVRRRPRVPDGPGPDGGPAHRQRRRASPSPASGCRAPRPRRSA